MIRAHHLLAHGDQPAAATLRARLNFDLRHRRRLTLTADSGEKVLLDLAQATRLRGGDRIAMEDGRVLVIEAEAEPVMDIHAADRFALTRLAWHLGNRHTPTALFDDRLRIKPDHVLAAMAEGLGARVESLEAPFDPEAGAYADGGGHHHHHDDHDHSRDHGHHHHHD